MKSTFQNQVWKWGNIIVDTCYNIQKEYYCYNYSIQNMLYDISNYSVSLFLSWIVVYGVNCINKNCIKSFNFLDQVIVIRLFPITQSKIICIDTKLLICSIYLIVSRLESVISIIFYVVKSKKIHIIKWFNINIALYIIYLVITYINIQIVDFKLTLKL